ncbi:MAG: zinc-dependent alcohol dehydrogenase family protein [bacterium]|nr:zinc-dependent alcohol dehydrogenase family protein [bacterium]
MKAMVLNEIFNILENREPLEPIDLPIPVPGDNEVLIKISTCGVCHTELDEIEGRTPPQVFPMILGHQAVGKVVGKGAGVKNRKEGARVGITWIYSACGKCGRCRSGEDNLCSEFKATGRDANGGYAEYMTIHENFTFPIPDTFTDFEAAPLLCAGAIGYRSIRLTNMKNGDSLGLTGFGASGHLVLKLAKYMYPDSDIYVFARSENEREFAAELGAEWAGDTTEVPPQKLDSIIDTTPVWKTVVEAMKNLKPGGRLVINAIRKEDIDKNYLLEIDYTEHLWMEKEIKSVANVASRDVREFLEIAANIPIRPEYQIYELEEVNKALLELKERNIRGAKVLKIS